MNSRPLLEKVPGTGFFAYPISAAAANRHVQRLMVLTLEADRVSAITWFSRGLFTHCLELASTFTRFPVT